MKSHVGMYQCFFCLEPLGILLDRRLKNTLPRLAGVLDLEPCSSCKGWMDQGILLISIRDNTSEEEMKGPIPNPYRTGGWTVVKDNSLKPILSEENFEFATKNRFMFITDEAWEKIGIPRGAYE